MSKYNVYMTLEPIYYHALKDTEKIIVEHRLSSVRCGFKQDKAESITRLVCANINNITVEDFFLRNKECTNIGSKIASNLIRVATRRIYSDPYRSFIEPVVNSIDSYNEMNGIVSTTGKFGMGFFSLLYWLLPNDDSKGNVMEIQSIYKEDNDYCSWTAYITYENDNFMFRLSKSVIMKKATTGTKIIFHFIEKQPIVSELFDNIIYDTFSLVPEFIIRNNHQQVNESYKGPEIDTHYKRNYIFEDNATGISISTFLTKLLVPSISTKTIAKSLTTELTYSKVKSDAKIISMNALDQRLKDKHIISQFFINIRGLSIYVESLTNDKMTSLMSRINNTEGNFIINNENLYTRFVLSLPDQTPLPVSRDDIIITDSVFYQATKRSFITLLHSCIDKDVSLDNMLIHLQHYANYANDSQVYRLIGKVTEYLYSLESIYLVPIQYKYFYTKVITPITGRQYVGIDNAPVTRLTDHLMNVKDIIKINRFTNRTILVVKDLKKLINVDYTTGGLISVIFVDSLFVNRKDWTSHLIASMREFLYDEKVTLGDEIKKLLSSKEALLGNWKLSFDFKAEVDILALKYMKKYADLIEMYVSREDITASYMKPTEGLYTYLYTFTAFLIKLSKDEAFLNNAFTMVYSSLYKVSNRNIHNTISFPYTMINDSSTPAKFSRATYSIGHYGILYKSLDNFSNVNTNYLLEYLWIFFGNLSNNINSKIRLLQPIVFSCFNVSRSYMKKEDYRNYIFKLIEYLYAKPPIYNIIYEFSKEDIYRYSNGIEYLAEKYFNYIYNELNVKYGLSTITRIVNDYINDENSVDIRILLNNLRLGISLLRKTLGSENYSVTYEYIDTNKFNFTFTANQLINYLFEHNVNTDSLDWLYDVVKYKSKSTVKFQALEIAINEGTSKAFIESVLTELTQNSIDAAKEFLHNAKTSKRYKDGRVICKNKKDKSIVELRDNQIVSQNYTGNKEPNRTCIDMLELIVGKINDHYGISVTDQVGIPIPGIIAIMLPFYSTKKADEVISTGEMGTGFMNVYRQPYCQEVWIRTFLQEETILIKVLPMLDNYNRVIDLQYNISRESDSTGFGTTVSILLRNNTDVNLTSMMLEALIYAYSFYPTINMKSYINNDEIKGEKLFLFENNIAKVYLRENETTSSVILTNGVPYSWLRNYIEEFNSGHIRNYASYNIIIDLKRDSYKPQQSRKRILLDTKTNEEFRETIALAAILNAIREVSKCGPNNGAFSGMDYSGNPEQRINKYENTLDNNLYLSDLRILTMKIYAIDAIIFRITYAMKKDNVKGSLIENVTRPYIVRGTKTIAKYPVVREMYINIIIKWFSNKTFDEEEKIDNIGKYEIIIPDDVVLFLNNLITHAWKEARDLIDRNELYPFNIINEAPILSYEKISPNTKGYYSPGQHRIVLNSHYYNDKIPDAIKKFLETYEINRDNAMRLIRTDRVLSELMGDKTKAVTLVHEFFHALRSDSHNGDVHGATSFTLEGLRYDLEFDAASNTIWRRLISTFVP